MKVFKTIDTYIDRRLKVKATQTVRKTVTGFEKWQQAAPKIVM